MRAFLQYWWACIIVWRLLDTLSKMATVTGSRRSRMRPRQSSGRSSRPVSPSPGGSAGSHGGLSIIGSTQHLLQVRDHIQVPGKLSNWPILNNGGGTCSAAAASDSTFAQPSERLFGAVLITCQILYVLKKLKMWTENTAETIILTDVVNSLHFVDYSQLHKEQFVARSTHWHIYQRSSISLPTVLLHGSLALHFNLQFALWKMPGCVLAPTESGHQSLCLQVKIEVTNQLVTWGGALKQEPRKAFYANIKVPNT